MGVSGLVTVASGVCWCVCGMRRHKGGAHNNTYTTWVQSPLLDNNNNRRRDVFCGEEEAKDGRLNREERVRKENERALRRSGV